MPSSVHAMEKLLADAHVAGIEVRFAHLPDDLLGCWQPGARTILIDARLTPVERTVVLAHELGHAHHGHLCGADTAPDLEKRQEHQADVYAAKALIDPLAYAYAEAINQDRHFLAEELGVTEDLVRVFEESCLTSVHGATYVNARHGVGQWDYRAERA